jgi:hypothetical protein
MALLCDLRRRRSMRIEPGATGSSPNPCAFMETSQHGLKTTRGTPQTRAARTGDPERPDGAPVISQG